MVGEISQNLEEDFRSLREGWNIEKVDRDQGAIWLSLKAYIHLLYRWANKLNLVSLNEIDFIATRHVWRALAMLPHVQSVPNNTIIDVGSGSGLPAIPLKICLPECQFYLVESRRKRANFLREVIRSLGLKKIEVVNERIENWSENVLGDVITARAVANPAEIRRWTAGHVATPSWLICTFEKKGLEVGEIGKEVECSWRGETMRIGLIPLSYEQAEPDY